MERHAGKERPQAEMIGLRKRIIFMVVATATGHGQAQEGRAGGVGQIGQQLIAILGDFLKNRAGAVERAQPHETGGDQPIGVLGRLRVRPATISSPANCSRTNWS